MKKLSETQNTELIVKFTYTITIARGEMKSVANTVRDLIKIVEIVLSEKK